MLNHATSITDHVLKYSLMMTSALLTVLGVSSTTVSAIQHAKTKSVVRMDSIVVR